MATVTYQRFSAKPGSGIRDDDANRIGSFLLDEYGDLGVTDDEYVKAARPARSPIHDTLEWDDAVCGELHRRQQAQHIIRNIVICDDEAEVGCVQAYYRVAVSHDDSPEERYVPQHVVWAREELSSQIVERERRELRATAARLAKVEELAHLAPMLNRAADGDAALTVEVLVAEERELRATSARLHAYGQQKAAKHVAQAADDLAAEIPEGL